jgi:hypothetical protein
MKGTHKCGGVRSVRGELHGALRDLGHLDPWGHLWNTILYKSSCWGQEHVGFALLRPHTSAARSGIQGKLHGALRDLKCKGRRLLDFSYKVEVCSYMSFILRRF